MTEILVTLAFFALALFVVNKLTGGKLVRWWRDR